MIRREIELNVMDIALFKLSRLVSSPPPRLVNALAWAHSRRLPNCDASASHWVRLYISGSVAALMPGKIEATGSPSGEPVASIIFRVRLLEI
jgi:hypothetical protein